MREEKIYIKNGSLIIEALWSRHSDEKGVVICHPHSLMGGSMYNNVVETIRESFAAAGVSTLRFNFRGVGRVPANMTKVQVKRKISWLSVSICAMPDCSKYVLPVIPLARGWDQKFMKKITRFFLSEFLFHRR